MQKVNVEVQKKLLRGEEINMFYESVRALNHLGS